MDKYYTEIDGHCEAQVRLVYDSEYLRGFWFTLHSTVAGLSESANFTTPPAVGASSVRAVIYGDMGQAERDNASIHYEEVCTWLSINLASLC